MQQMSDCPHCGKQIQLVPNGTGLIGKHNCFPGGEVRTVIIVNSPVRIAEEPKKKYTIKDGDK